MMEKKSSYCLYLRQVFITLQENMGCLQECKLKLILYGFSINTKNIIPGKKKHFATNSFWVYFGVLSEHNDTNISEIKWHRRINKKIETSWAANKI